MHKGTRKQTYRQQSDTCLCTREPESRLTDNKMTPVYTKMYQEIRLRDNKVASVYAKSTKKLGLQQSDICRNQSDICRNTYARKIFQILP